MQRTFGNNVKRLPRAGLNTLFLRMSAEFREEVVRHALGSRDQVSANARDALSKAVDWYITLNGFRQGKAGGAPPEVLLTPVAESAQAASDLAAAVLRVWGESKKPLRMMLAGYLEDCGVTPSGFEFPGHEIVIAEGAHPLVEAVDAFLTSQPDADADEARLMMELMAETSVISGEPADAPGSAIADRLAAALRGLSELPAGAAEWGQVVPDFVSDLTNLVEAKNAERALAFNLDGVLAEILESYGELVKFFQWDTSRWASANLAPGVEIPQAYDLAQQAKELLSQYAPIHERAPVASEEISRAERRLNLMPRIVEAGEALGKMMGLGDGVDRPKDDGPGDAGPGDGGPGDSGPGYGGPGDGGAGDGGAGDYNPVDDDAPIAAVNVGTATEASPGGDDAFSEAGHTVESTGLPNSSVSVATSSRPLDHPADAPSGSDAASAASPWFPSCSIEGYLLLRQENLELEHEIDELEKEAQTLKERLFASRNRGEGLSQALTNQDNGGGGDEAKPVGDVAEAVELAKAQFDGRLHFQFNSESNIGDNPFKWPNRVWRAFEWLATDYYDARVGLVTNADMDASCRQVSGMWYKSNQHDATMSAYRNSYTTKVEGRTIWLNEHIGKGTGFDARRTIRIGFDWDRASQKVIIGYLGQHQRTSAS